MKNFIKKIKSILANNKKADNTFEKIGPYKRKDLSKIWKILIIAFIFSILVISLYEFYSFLKLSKEEFVFTEEELSGFITDDNSERISELVERFSSKNEVFKNILGYPMQIHTNSQTLINTTSIIENITENQEDSTKTNQ